MDHVVHSRASHGRRPRTSAKAGVAVTVLGSLSLILAACGSSDEGSTGGGEDTGGPVELVVWASREFYVPGDKFEDFTAEHPDITITYDVRPGDDILLQLQRMADAGQPLPDVIQDDTPLLAAYVELGIPMAIEDIIAAWQEEDPETYDHILPIAWDDATLDGTLYGMASVANADFMYYNVPWFEEAGIDPDTLTTWDDIKDASATLKEARPDADPFGVPFITGQGVSDRVTMMNGAGVEFVDGIPQLTSEAGLYVVDWYQQMASDGLLSADALAYSADELWGSFIAGDTGMMIEGLATAKDFEGVLEFGTEWDTFSVPLSRSGGEDGFRTAKSRSWMITAGTEHPEEAGLVLRHLASSEQLLSMVEQGGAGPRNTEALESDFLTEFWPFFGEEEKAGFTEATSIPPTPVTPDVDRILELMFQEIVQGTDESAEQLAERYQQELDALL